MFNVKITKRHFLKTIILPMSITLSACGGSGGGSSTSSVDSNEELPNIETPSKQYNAIVINKRTAFSGALCPNGGVEVDTGVDTNGNGVLDTSEVTETVTLCHGSDGADGTVAIIKTTDLPDGGDCLLGGVSIESGMDVNGNAKLDASEVQSTSNICNFMGLPLFKWIISIFPLKLVS